jgi:hypothetical protein
MGFLDPKPVTTAGLDAATTTLAADPDSDLAGELSATIGTEVSTPGKAARTALDGIFARNEDLAAFPVSKYGDIKQATYITDAAMTAGSAILDSTAYTFTNADVGKTVGVRGAGPVGSDYTVLANDGVLVTTISSVAGGNAVLAAVATNTCSGVNAAFGWPIDAALVAADAAAAAAGGGNILIPRGNWITTVKWDVTPGNGVIGAGRDLTRVFYVKTGDGTSNATTPWLSTGGANWTKTSHIRDFHADAQFFVATTGVGSMMKVIFVANTQSSTIKRMRISDCPATAIGYDESRNCLIEDNIITNVGRLSPRSLGAGYSGIGITVGDSFGPASCIIRGNYINGGWLADEDIKNKNAHTGIHLEGVFTDASDAGGAPQDAYIIEGNIITGCGIGIRDSGALGTIINGNRITGCKEGILLAHKGGSGSRVPRDTVVTNNVIRDLINPAVLAPTECYGIRVDSSLTTYTNHGHAIISNNVISAVPKYGIYLNGDSTNPLTHVRVANNMISDCDQYGIYVREHVKNVVIAENNLIANGRGGVNTGAIGLDTLVDWTDGRIEGNDFSDYQTVPTQTNAVVQVGSPTLTGVFIGGNSDDRHALRSDVRLKWKASTSTITSNTTLATLAGFTIPVVAGEYYEFTALIRYTAGTTPNLKLGLFLGTGATAQWWADGPGAPQTQLSTADTVVLNGGAGTLAATIQGVFYAGTTNFNFGIQAAQAVSDPGSTVVTTASRMTVRRVTKLA